MFNRAKHRWSVRVQKENGQAQTERVDAYWDPQKEETAEAIATCARVQVQTKTKMGAAVVGSPVHEGVV